MPTAILALDQGTTSSRAIVFDGEGRPLASAQRELRQFYPQPGWVEHDATEIWSTQSAVMAEAIAKVSHVEIAAIGITNQRETTVVWDRETGAPVANAIVWQDRRTAAMCDALREHEALVREKTGLVIDAYFSGTKLRWLLDRCDRDPERLAFGTIDSWLVWNLTRGTTHITDVTNASRTMLFDIHRAEWDDELLELLGVPRCVLPQVKSSSEIYAKTSDGIPIAGIAGDQQASLFGQRCTRAGMAKNTYGTGSFVVMNTGERAVSSKNGLLATIAWQLGDATPRYALEGSIFITGAAVQWLRDGLGIIRTAPEVEALAASVPDSGGVVVVPAFTGLGTPHWDAYARGTISGITRGTTAAHIARATLESIALQTADVLDAMQLDSGITIDELRVDGGASTNDLLMQLQADIAGIPVVRTRVPETTALGAAYLAGLAAGFYRDLDAQWKADRVFTPYRNASERASLRERWARGVERAKGWAI
jgi:glycerol kinase